MTLTPAPKHVATTPKASLRQRLATTAAIIAAAALAVTGIVAISTPAYATTGLTLELSGHVIIPDQDGLPVAAGLDDVLVTAYLLDDSVNPAVAVQQAQVTTDADGKVTFDPLPAGSYAFEYDYRGGGTINVADSFGDGRVTLDEELASSWSAFTPIIEDGAISLDYEMQVGGILQGHAQTFALAPLSGQPVELWRLSVDSDGAQAWVQDPGSDATTDTLGDYQFSSLPGGTYTVRVGGKNNYIPEFWEDKLVATADEAESFPISTGGGPAVTKLSTLGLGGRINGVVKNTSNQALRDVVATAYIYNGSEYLPFASAVTSTTGAYSITGLPAGTYKVGFSSSDIATVKYIDRYWSTAATLDAGLAFPLAAGATKLNVNVLMTKGASFSGVVSLEGGGFPAASDITIQACATYSYCPDDGSEDQGTVSYNPATGAYSVGALPAGSFDLTVTYTGTGNFRSERYDNVHNDEQPTPIVVATGATLTGKSIQLDHGATISGHVLANGVARAGVRVAVYVAGQSAGQYGYPERSTLSDATGAYTLTGLDEQNYSVRAEPGATFAWQWSNGTYSPRLARVIPAVGGGTTSDADFDLETGATIEGDFTTVDDGLPADPGFTIYRFTSAGGTTYSEYYGSSSSMSNGHYTITQLPPGEYAIQAEEDVSHNIIGRFAGGTGVDIQHAGRITLTSGSTETADIALDRAGTYTGRVVDELGNPIAGVAIEHDNSYLLCEYYSDCTTDSDGYFAVRQVLPGVHELTLTAPDDSPVIPLLTVTAPAITVNTAPVDLGNLVLENGSTVSGIVVGIDGKPMKDVQVVASVPQDDSTLQSVGSDYTDNSGRFSVERLPSDAVFLDFTPYDYSNYSEQYLGGNFDWTLSESVPLPVAGSKAFVEARLVTGGSITGVVTNKVTGAGIGGVDVLAMLTKTIGDTYYGNSRDTNSKGAFAIPGLEPGSYTVSYNEYASAGSSPYLSTSKSVFLPERGIVKANATLTPGVKISGILRDGTGAALPYSDVAALPVAGNPAAEVDTQTDDKGAYSLYVQPGTWVLHAYDFFRRGAGVFTGGSVNLDTATPIVATKAAIVSNLTLPIVTSAIHADSVFGSNDPNPDGSVALERIVGGDVVSTEYWGVRAAYGGEQYLGSGFTLDNVPPGDYRLVIDARPLGTFDSYYDQKVVDGIHVDAALTTDIGNIDLGVAHDTAQTDLVVPVPGSEPVALNLDADFTVGAHLHVDAGTWTETPVDYTYKWMRDGHPISGATGSDYQVTPGDSGKAISVQVVPQFDDTYSLGYIASLAGTVVPGAQPFPLDPPLVAGTPRVGQTLTASHGNWNLPGVTFSYQWLRNGSPIATAIAATYKPVAADVGEALSVRVYAKRAGFYTGSADATVPAVQSATAMTRKVAGVVTATLDGWKVTPGTWVPAVTAAAFSYAWRVYDDAGVPTDYPGTSQFADGTIAPAGVKAGTDRVSVLVTAAKAGYTTTTVEVPVRTGPLPSFAAPTAAHLESAAGAPARVGYPLTLVDAANLDPKPTAGVSTYQWFRSVASGGPFTAIPAATSTTYTPVALDAGKFLSVGITLRAPGRALPTAPQVRVVFPTTTELAQPFVLGTPLISGQPTVGSTLTADPGTWDPAPTTFAYQWLRAGVAIKGAVKATYTLGALDNGKNISVRVTGSKSGLASASVVSADVPVGGAAAFTATVAPTVTGTPAVGQTLTANPGVWTPAATAVAYQWYRDGVKIAGATRSTYVVAAPDNGKALKVVTTGSRAGWLTTFTESSAIPIGAAVPTTIVTAPSIGNVARVGTKLTATNGTWLLPPTGYIYQWLLNGVPIDGANTNSYTPIIADLGEEISVAVTAKKTAFPDSAPEKSAAVTVEPGAPISPSAAPALSVLAKAAKSLKFGQTVSTTAGTWPVAALSLSYQWQVDRLDGAGFTDVVGATTKSLLIDADGYFSDTADPAVDPEDFTLGFKYRVLVHADRTGYQDGPPAVSTGLTLIG